MASSLCENCHKRPKFRTHRFCGKTCAAQATAKLAQPRQSQVQGKSAPRNAGYQRAAPVPQKTTQLCIHCGQNPKFSNFDYCSKSCAALASATRSKQPLTQGNVQTTTYNAARAPNAAPNNNVPTPAPAKAPKTHRTKIPVPQDDSTEEEEEEDGSVSTDLDAYPSDTESEPEDSPSVPTTAVSQPSTKSTLRGGCGQPSHVDRKGVTTRYCSVKHREEAVKLGLEQACIMCQRYPQSSSDYFCSSACRNQSMTKT